MKNLSSNRSEPAATATPLRLALRPVAWTACVVALGACSLQRPLDFPTASRTDTPPSRKPDGVAVDLEGALPPPAARADTDAALVALREPVAPDAALEVVREFFQAVRRTDMPALRLTISPEATAAPIGAAAGPPADAQWDRRLRKFDYRTLGGSTLFLDSAVEIYRYGDLDNLVGDRPARPSLMAPTDVLIRVPIATTRIGVDRVFGDEMLFVVRRVDRAFRIQAIFEDFQVP